MGTRVDVTLLKNCVGSLKRVTVVAHCDDVVAHWGDGVAHWGDVVGWGDVVFQ